MNKITDHRFTVQKICTARFVLEIDGATNCFKEKTKKTNLPKAHVNITMS